MMIRLTAICALCLGMAACAAPGGGGAIQIFKGEPAGLIGLQDEQVRQAFGTPVFVRNDGQSVIWRYDGGSCRAFFFFTGGAALTVHHVETLPHGSGIAADATCLSALQAAHAGAKPVS